MILPTVATLSGKVFTQSFTTGGFSCLGGQLRIRDYLIDLLK